MSKSYTVFHDPPQILYLYTYIAVYTLHASALHEYTHRQSLRYIMSYAQRLISSTPDSSKKRVEPDSLPNTSASTDNPEKKNKQADVSNISAIADSPRVHLADTDFLKIQSLVKDMMHTQIEPMVKSIVSDITSVMTTQISNLEKERDALRSRVKSLEDKVESLDIACDTAEQYSRRNCLRIVGVPEDPLENTDDVILNIAKETQSNITIADIDRSHRVAQPETRTSPKSIIVKFVSYRARYNFYKNRSSLKGNATFPSVYINEDLTSARNKLFGKARKLMKDGKISKCWTYDGRINIVDNSDTKFVVNQLSELDKFK